MINRGNEENRNRDQQYGYCCGVGDDDLATWYVHPAAMEHRDGAVVRSLARMGMHHLVQQFTLRHAHQEQDVEEQQERDDPSGRPRRTPSALCQNPHAIALHQKPTEPTTAFCASSLQNGDAQAGAGVGITDSFEDFPVVLPQWSYPFLFRTRRETPPGRW